MVRISKTLVAGISALAMAAAVVLPTTPASAGGWRGGGGAWHGGGGGWRGGGWGAAAGRWRLAWRRLGGAWRLAWRLLARRILEQRLVGPRGRRRRDRRRGDRHLPLLGRLWLWRRLLAGSADLRRLRQLSRRPVRERLLTFTAIDAFDGASREAGPFSCSRPEDAAGHRLRRAGRGRKGDRQAASRAQRQIGETLRLDAVAVEADRLDRLDFHPQPLAKPQHEVRVSPSAAADQPARRRARNVLQRRGGQFDREGGKRRRAIRVAQAWMQAAAALK